MVIVQHVTQQKFPVESWKQLAFLGKCLIFIKPDLDFPSKLTEKYFSFPWTFEVCLITPFRTSFRVSLIENCIQVNLYSQKQFKVVLTFF